MAVVNKVPVTLANDYKGNSTGLTAAADKWVADNGAWLKRVVDQHETFISGSQIDQYQAVYDGEIESIDTRDKSRGDDINHKLQVSLAQLVIDTVVDYMTGKPITWTVEATDLPKEDTTTKAIVEEYRKEILQLLRSENAQRVLSEQLRHGGIGGYSPIISWVDEDGEIDYDEFPIQESIPVYDSRGKLRLFIRKYSVVDEAAENPVTRIKLEIYDTKYVIYCIQDEGGTSFQLDTDEVTTGNPIVHFAGRIPVSLFTNGTPAKYEDRRKRVGMSDIKLVFSLLENLAEGMSDKANTVDRLLDQFLLFKNVTTTEDEVVKMRKARAIILKNKDSDASFLAPNQDDKAVENHLDRLEEMIHKTTQTPKINDISGATATEIKMKYAPLDIKAGKKELYFSQAIHEFIEVLTDLLNARRILAVSKDADIYSILHNEDQTQTSVPLYKAEWLQFTINRNLPQNFLEIAQIVSTLVDIVPDSYLYELLWFIEDPVAALKEMKAQKDATASRSAQAGLSALGYGGEFGSTGTAGGAAGGNNNPPGGNNGAAGTGAGTGA